MAKNIYTLTHQLVDSKKEVAALKASALEYEIKTRAIIDQQQTDSKHEQQKAITEYYDNPAWLVQREEVVLTEYVIGRGGWYEVKVGIFRETKVAVKRLHEAIVSDYNIELQSREIDIMSRLRHPNIVQFIGATRVGVPIFLTELMPTSLSNELDKKNITRAQGIAISIDIILALNYLHSWKPHPILHRNISSRNILLLRSYKAKLSPSISMNFLDKIHTPNPGSPIYSAPEVHIPSKQSTAMDIFSFGVLLFEIINVRSPSHTHSERMEEIATMEPGAIQALIISCTVEDPLARPSAKDVLKHLQNL